MATVTELLEQAEKLKAAKENAISGLLAERISLTTATEKRLKEIVAELSALGYVKHRGPRKAKEAAK